MDLTELLEIAQRERTARKPMQLRCCVAASCLSADSLAVKQRLAAVTATGLEDKVQVCGVGCMRLCCLWPLVQFASSTLCEKVTPLGLIVATFQSLKLPSDKTLAI